MNTSHNKVLNTMLMMLGVIIFLFGGFGVLAGLISLVDPIGVQLANDADPFGVSQSRSKIAILTLFYASLTLVGGWIFNRSRRNNKENDNIQK